MNRKLRYGDSVVIGRNCRCAKRYRGRTAVVDHQFKDGRVLLHAPDRKSKLGLNMTEVTKS